jgi:hypothetical protein
MSINKHRAVHVFYLDIRDISPADVHSVMRANADALRGHTSDENVITYTVPIRGESRIEVHYPDGNSQLAAKVERMYEAFLALGKAEC